MESLRRKLQQAIESSAVSLEDSGLGERLERFGERLIRRPSSLAIWQRKMPVSHWNQADATYVPQQGWSFRADSFQDWIADLGAFRLKLIPQENGQTGLFPEHLEYFSRLSQHLEQLRAKLDRPVRVLNLFAYTGMATVWCALHGAEVTHIELSKRILSWARENLELNGKFDNTIRFIPEDAVTFLERELRRGSTYDLIISDPPSFSRVSKGQSWDLEEIIVAHIRALTQVLNPGGSIFLTSHHHLLNSFTLENLFLDLTSAENQFSFEASELTVAEHNSQRRLACGSLLITTRR